MRTSACLRYGRGLWILIRAYLRTPTAVASGLGFGVYLTPYSAEAGDLPRGSQEEGRRHGGRRPIKVYAFTLQRRIGWSSGDEGPSLKPDLNPSKPVPSTRIRTVAAGDRSICSTKW